MFIDTQIATGAAGFLASNSAQLVDISSNSYFAQGIYDIFSAIYVVGWCICFYSGFMLGAWWFRR